MVLNQYFATLAWSAVLALSPAQLIFLWCNISAWVNNLSAVKEMAVTTRSTSYKIIYCERINDKYGTY